MTPHISIAGERESETVLTLIAQLLDELGAEGAAFSRVDQQRLRTDLKTRLADGRFSALLAHDSFGHDLGVLTLSQAFAVYAGGEYGIIDELYVRETHRRKGVGRALFEAAFAVARARKWHHLDVTTPQAADHGTVAGFYHHLGFTATGTKLRFPLNERRAYSRQP